jgi:hypothetical protein
MPKATPTPEERKLAKSEQQENRDWLAASGGRALAEAARWFGEQIGREDALSERTEEAMRAEPKLRAALGQAIETLSEEWRRSLDLPKDPAEWDAQRSVAAAMSRMWAWGERHATYYGADASPMERARAALAGQKKPKSDMRSWGESEERELSSVWVAAGFPAEVMPVAWGDLLAAATADEREWPERVAKAGRSSEGGGARDDQRGMARGGGDAGLLDQLEELDALDEPGFEEFARGGGFDEMRGRLGVDWRDRNDMRREMGRARMFQDAPPWAMERMARGGRGDFFWVGGAIERHLQGSAQTRETLRILALTADQIGRAAATAWPERAREEAPAALLATLEETTRAWAKRSHFAQKLLRSAEHTGGQAVGDALRQALAQRALLAAQAAVRAPDAESSAAEPWEIFENYSEEAPGEEIRRSHGRERAVEKERSAVAALEAIHAQGARLPDSFFGPKTLAFAAAWKARAAKAVAGAEAVGAPGSAALWLAEGEAGSGLKDAFALIEPLKVVGWGQLDRMARELSRSLAQDGGLAGLASESRGRMGKKTLAERAEAMAWPLPEKTGAGGEPMAAVFGAFVVALKDGRWTFGKPSMRRSAMKAVEAEPWNDKSEDRAWEMNRQARDAIRGAAESAGGGRAEGRARQEQEDAARGLAIRTPAAALREISAWLNDETWRNDRRTRLDAELKTQLRVLAQELAIDKKGNSERARNEWSAALGMSAANAIGRWAESRGAQHMKDNGVAPGAWIAGAQAAARLARLTDYSFAGWDGSRFASAMIWVGADPAAAGRVAQGGATGLGALASGSAKGELVGERLPQAAKALWSAEGLSPAGWRWLTRAPAEEAANLRQLWARTPEDGGATALVVVANAMAEANADPAGGLALIGLGGDASQLTRHWGALSEALRLPEPVVAADERERGKQIEKQPDALLTDDERALQAKWLIVREIEKRAAARKKLAKAVEESDAAGAKRLGRQIEKHDIAIAAMRTPETDEQRDRRHEMTRALARWAADLAAKEKLGTGERVRGSERFGEHVEAKTRELRDWLAMDAGARERLPRRFGVSALQERARLWHEELARQVVVNKQDKLMEVATQKASEAVRSGHAPNLEAALAAIGQGGWPMAIARVVGEPSPSAESRGAAAAGAKVVESEAAAEEGKSFEGWEAVGLATPQALADEGRAMAHCVGGYADLCAENTSRIFHVQNESNQRVGTLELRASGGKWKKVQFLGPHNQTISDPAAKSFAQHVAREYTAAALANQSALLAAIAAKRETLEQTARNEQAERALAQGAAAGPAAALDRLQARRAGAEGGARGGEEPAGERRRNRAG